MGPNVLIALTTGGVHDRIRRRVLRIDLLHARLAFHHGHRRHGFVLSILQHLFLHHQAVSLLKRIKSYNWSDEWLFPGNRGNGLGAGAFKKPMAKMGYPSEKVQPHGFRSTFSTHANESGLWNRDAIEWVLAHSEKNEVRAAYNRAQYLEERRQILQWWGDQLDEARDRSSNVK